MTCKESFHLNDPLPLATGMENDLNRLLNERDLK